MCAAGTLSPFLIEPTLAYHYTDIRKSERVSRDSEMASELHSPLNWKALIRVQGFPRKKRSGG